MKKIELYSIELLLFIAIIVFNFGYRNIYLLDASILIIGVYCLIRFGLMKDNNYLKKNVTKLVISCILVYFLTIYALGLVLCFHKTVFSFHLKYIFGVIVLEALVIIAEELIRYIICRNTPHQKLPIILYTLILSLLNIIIVINGYNLKDNEVFFIFITTIVIPSIARESICSFLTYKVSYLPSMIYKLTIILYPYILPIIPNLGNYLSAISGIALPYAIFYMVSKMLHYKDKAKEYQQKATRRMIYAPAIAVLIVIVMLVSGLFNHKIIAIGSNSMSPKFEKGDTVIFEKKDIEKIQLGEVIAFQKKGKLITHRVINKKELGSKVVFKTKGDANNAPDSFEVEDNEVLGVVKYTVKYLGYPTLWFNELYERKGTDS